MDPVSAEGFASSIITFIDFSTKLVKGSYYLYKAGGNEQHGQLSNVLDEYKADAN